MATTSSFLDSLPEFSSSVEVDVLEESEISVRVGASQLDVPSGALRAFARERNVLVGEYLPLEAYQRFTAAISLYRRNYYDEKTAIAKIGSKKKLGDLVKHGKIRAKFYHGIPFYHRGDVDAACKPKILVKKMISLAQKTKSLFRFEFIPNPLTMRPVTTEKGAITTGARVFINGEECVSIAQTARLLGEKIATVWQWIHKNHFLPFVESEEDWVKLADVEVAKLTPFFTQSRYTFTQIGQKYGITRFTVGAWTRRENGVVATPCPGGQKYILADQLEKCAELAERAHKFNPYKK